MAENTASLTDLRSALETKQAFITEGIQKGVKIESFKDDNGVEQKGVKVTESDWEALKTAHTEKKQIEALIQMQEMDPEVKALLTSLENPATGSSAMQAAALAAMGVSADQMQSKSLGQRFTGSDEFKALVTSGGLTMPQPFSIEGEQDIIAQGGYGQKDVYGGLLTGATNPRGFGRVQFDPMVPRAQRTTRVRDLFPAAATSANLIDYFRVLGFSTGADKRGAAASVADYSAGNFGLKPKSQLTFQPAQAPVRTIAHWEAAHRNVLADEPQLQATIDNELLYGLALAEDDQILNGDGTGENLLGILNTSGIQTYNQNSNVGDRMSDALRRSATLSVLANFPGTGFVLHPFDWEQIELQKATGDGQYMLVTNFAVGASTTIWRQPVVETPAISENTWLTGAFGLGAQLYDRQVANVRIAEQHADFFVRNAVAILAEERLALAVKRPESFVKGTFNVTGIGA